MNFILEGIGWFIYPMGLCSLVAMYVIIERTISLRSNNVIPKEIITPLLSGVVLEDSYQSKSALGRILNFNKKNNPDSESLKAFALLEISRLERGMFLLDFVVSAAPLLGLLGTVSGLVAVFSTDGIPQPENISRGMGLALSTTIIGLSIAIPALAAAAFLRRRVEMFAVKINICVESLIDFNNKK